MEQDGQPNHAGNGKIYVKFGHLPNQEMPREWAEKMLTKWREKKPTEFGKMLAEVVTGER